MRGQHILALMVTLALSGCASFTPDAGLNEIGLLTGTRPVAIRSESDATAIRDSLEPILRKRISADDAVRVALMNNRDLQAVYNTLGLAETQLVAQSLPPNPRFGISRLAGGGMVELEAQAAASILALATLPARAEIARDVFSQAQYTAAYTTLRIAALTRAAYYRAVAARVLSDFLEQSQSAAQAAAQIATRLGDTGTLNKLDQARNQVFYAELSAQLATARQRADSEREVLVRLMGLWGDDLAFRLPSSLPRLPSKALALPEVEREAIARRLDIQAKRMEVTSLAKAYNLTTATRFINLLEVAGLSKTDRDATDTTRQRGFDIDFQVPIFDLGAVASRRAQETYLRAINELSANAVNARSQARDAYRTYRSSFDIARHYQRDVLPLRKIISDESLLRYNAMQIDVFTLLEEARRRIASTMAAIEAERNFWLAQSNLGAAITSGTATETPSNPSASAPLDSGGAGH